MKIQVDLDALALSKWGGADSGEPPPRAPTCGLVLVAEWGWASQPGVQVCGCFRPNTLGGGTRGSLPNLTSASFAKSERYEALKRSAEAAGGGALYVYPAHATHVTVATLSSFKKTDAPRVRGEWLGHEERRRY